MRYQQARKEKLLQSWQNLVNSEGEYTGQVKSPSGVSRVCRSVTMADMKERFVPENRVSLKVSIHILQVFHMPTIGDSADQSYIPAPAIYIPTSDGQYQRPYAQFFVAALLNRGA